jgi:hypothetical protein
MLGLASRTDAALAAPVARARPRGGLTRSRACGTGETLKTRAGSAVVSGVSGVPPYSALINDKRNAERSGQLKPLVGARATALGQVRPAPQPCGFKVRPQERDTGEPSETCLAGGATGGDQT